MSYFPMSTYAGGDSFGLDRLSLKTEDGSDEYLADFRLYARQNEEIKTRGGGGGSSQYHPDNPPTFSSPDAENQFNAFPVQSQNIFRSTEQFPIPQTSSPTSYESEMGYSSEYYHMPPYADAMANPNYPPQQMPELSQHWESSGSTSQYLELPYDPPPTQPRSHYRETAYYSGSASSSSSRNSYESLPDTFSRMENKSRMEMEAQRMQRLETLEILRRMHNIPEGVPINLDALPDIDNRRAFNMGTLVHFAIAGSPNFRMSVSEIRTAIANRYSVFRDGSQKWKGSIRHMLSLKGEFRHVPRPITEPGQGNYWSLDMTITKDKRPRKRKARKTRRGDSVESPRQDEGEEPEFSAEPQRSSRPGSGPKGKSSRKQTSRLQKHPSPYGARPDTSGYQRSTPSLRSGSESNLTLGVEAMGISMSHTSAGSAYLDSPAAQSPYDDTWLDEHSHKSPIIAAPAGYMSTDEYLRLYGPQDSNEDFDPTTSLNTLDVQRPSFRMPSSLPAFTSDLSMNPYDDAGPYFATSSGSDPFAPTINDPNATGRSPRSASSSSLAVPRDTPKRGRGRRGGL